MKKKFLLAFLVFLLSVSSVTHAVHYVDYSNSVDDGEIRWGWSTKYSSQLSIAIATWNNYWDIDILPDIRQTYEDVHVSDVYYPDETWRWKWSHWFGTDTIKFNTAEMDDGPSSFLQKTVTHEFWHALWLDHSYYWNIMYRYPASQSYLWNQDEDDYDYLWWN